MRAQCATLVDIDSYRLEEQTFPCREDYHLARMNGGIPAYVFYLHAVQKSRKDVFCESLADVARVYACHKSTVRRNLQTLVKGGFLEVLQQDMCSPTVYRVISHDEWAEKNPGQCISFTWPVVVPA